MPRARRWSYLLLMYAITGCGAGTPAHTPLVAAVGSENIGPGGGRAGTSLLVEPGAGVKPLVRSLDAARNRIFLEAYILTEPGIVRALERAAAQGVAVDVLLDPHPFGMGRQPEQMADTLRASSVSVRWTSPRFRFTHAKFLLVDDRLAIVSTANFSRAAFRSNREFLVFDRNREDVHDLSNLFRTDWDRVRSAIHNAELVLSPGSRPYLTTFLNDTQRSLDVYAEEVADPALERVLVRLSRRVRVRVVVASTYRSAGLTRIARSGVAVRTLRYPYIHAKMFLRDESVAFLGSENMSPTSLDANREVGILVRGRAAQRAAGVFAHDWSNARPEGSFAQK